LATLLLDHGADPNLRNKQDPSISPGVVRETPGEMYCRTQSGKRKHPSAQQLSEFEAMKMAFARHGVKLPCGL